MAVLLHLFDIRNWLDAILNCVRELLGTSKEAAMDWSLRNTVLKDFVFCK